MFSLRRTFNGKRTKAPDAKLQRPKPGNLDRTQLGAARGFIFAKKEG